MKRRVRSFVERWWNRGGGLMGRALSLATWPAERLFMVTVALRNNAYDRGWLSVQRAGIPVISVGNLSVGGEGKTPLTAWIARELERLGERPAVVMRGYAADEVLVHRELNPGIPVFTSRRRVHGTDRAAAEGRSVAVLDDAFQHRALYRDLDVVVLAAERWTRAPRALPRGPSRESFSALRRADFAVVTRKSAGSGMASEVGSRVIEVAPRVGVAICVLEITGFSRLGTRQSLGTPTDWLPGREVVALTAIGDPESFARQLRGFGCAVELIAFPDHHAFTSGEVRLACTRAAGRPLVVTRKDAVKLSHLRSGDMKVVIAEQGVRFEHGEEEFRTMLRRAVSQ